MPAAAEYPAAVRRTPALLERLVLAAAVLAAESLAVGSVPHPWFHPQQAMAGPVALGAAVVLVVWHNERLAKASPGSVRWGFAALHGAALAMLAAMTWMLLHGTAMSPAHAACTALWYGSLALLVFTLAMALFRLRLLASALLRLRWDWLYVLLAAGAAMSARAGLRWVWNAPESPLGHALQRSTFASVRELLSLFYARVIARGLILGTPKFHVQIAGVCSGIEGLALVLLFTICWLVLTRRELRLARALLLIPMALILSWMLNTLRIAALIALGDAGHAELAINGFHSEAGWIFFNVVAVVFLVAVQRVQWLRKSESTRATLPAGRNVAAPYLMPLLAVLATAMLTHAFSSGFDWLYPLRLIVGGGVLFYFRREYRALDWRCGWVGMAAGGIVFGLWLAASRLQGPDAPLMASALAASPAPQRVCWMVARVLAAVTTVPLAEELAFRGYLARLLVSADVESVRFARLSWLAIAGSAVVFGLVQGRLWGVGMVAGAIFALVAKRRDRIGEAVGAHLVANVSIAVWVVLRGEYGRW